MAQGGLLLLCRKGSSDKCRLITQFDGHPTVREKTAVPGWLCISRQCPGCNQIRNTR